MTYAAADLLAEVAYVSRSYGWQLETVMGLEHTDRHHFMTMAMSGPPTEGTGQDR